MHHLSNYELNCTINAMSSMFDTVVVCVTLLLIARIITKSVK